MYKDMGQYLTHNPYCRNNQNGCAAVMRISEVLGEGNGTPLQCSCLENPRDGGAWWAAVYGVAQSRTRLKRLSSSSILIPGKTVNVNQPELGGEETGARLLGEGSIRIRLSRLPT